MNEEKRSFEGQQENEPEAQARRTAPRHRGPMGGPHGMMPGEKATDFKGSMKKLLSLMGTFKFALAAVIMFAIASTVFNIVGPKVLSTATTELFEGVSAKIAGTGGIDFTAVAVILVTTLALYGFICAACCFVQGWLMSHISQRTCYVLRQRIAKKMNVLPMGYFERTSTGDVLSRITNDVDTLGQSLNQGVTQIITSVTTILGVLIMMLCINALHYAHRPSYDSGLSAPRQSGGRSQSEVFPHAAEPPGAINGQVEETFSGQAVVRAFNKEGDVLETFAQTNDELYESAWKSQFLSGLMMPVMNFVSNLGYVAVAAGGQRVCHERAYHCG
ncbi:MAG: ABC transporter ATP-binding protein [Senegalimassilia faecalis]